MACRGDVCKGEKEYWWQGIEGKEEDQEEELREMLYADGGVLITTCNGFGIMDICVRL